LRFEGEEVVVRVNDGSELRFALSRFPRLAHATSDQRKNWKLIGGGVGLHWPEIDEDISVEGLVQGAGDVTRLGREHDAGDCPECRATAGN
jgi:hypothetical protein